MNGLQLSVAQCYERCKCVHARMGACARLTERAPSRIQAAHQNGSHHMVLPIFDLYSAVVRAGRVLLAAECAAFTPAALAHS
jgi:hypothetical protein